MGHETTGAGAPPQRASRSITTRRGFIAAASLGAVSLYGLWGAYGAAPLSLFGGGHREGGHEPASGPGGHGGHGATARGATVDEFRRNTEAFIARYRQPDGSVLVEPGAAPAAPSTMSGHDGHGAGHAGHGASHEIPAAAPAPATDVYLLAQQFLFEPGVIRLRAGAPYLFRMLAVDVAHGASLQLGRASRIVRLRPGTPVAQEIAFTRPGEHLIYGTLYCGIGHDRMSGRIIVT